MARARQVTADQNSQELDELRRQFNNLLLVLENVASEVDAGNITADEAFTALVTTLTNGSDETITSIDGGANTYTGTQREMNGVRPTPTHPRRPRKLTTEEMDNTADF